LVLRSRDWPAAVVLSFRELTVSAAATVPLPART
jgi:hypothetical protein